jgi:hypothetical protein
MTCRPTFDLRERKIQNIPSHAFDLTGHACTECTSYVDHTDVFRNVSGVESGTK